MKTGAIRTGSKIAARLLGHRAKLLASGWAVMIFATLVAGTAYAGVPDSWTPVASMATGRFLDVSAPLPGGSVLVAGGQTTTGGAVTSSAERYDPATSNWTSAGDMSTPRFMPGAAALASGKVLVAGGMSTTSIGDALDTGEVYDPATNGWTSVANLMSSTRGALPATVLLSSGKVLIAGGADASGNPLAGADLYDPVSNTFTPAGAMSDGRAFLSGIRLPSGKVLVAGGQDVNSGPPVATAEVYDPGTNSWSPVHNTMSVPRLLPGMAILPDGRVLVVGGVSSGPTVSPPSTTTATTDFYDPATNSFSPGPPMLVSRAIFGTTTLADGRVLVTGGVTLTGSSGSLTGDTEIYDPGSNSWSEAGGLPPVAGLTVNLLPNGDVLAAGGTSDFSTPSNQADTFTPTSIPGPPVAVSAAPGNASALVTFAPPVSDGGLRVQRYTITASTGQTVTTPDGRTFATVPGLTNGRRVTFTVTATNSLGTGPPSAPSNPVTPHAPDKAPVVRIFGLARRLSLTHFLTGVTFSVGTSKAASLRISLLATAKHATIARARDMTLAFETLRRSARRRAVDLVPARNLVGQPRAARVELVIVASDAAGSRSTASRWITVVRSPRAVTVSPPRPPSLIVVPTKPVTVTAHGEVPIQVKCPSHAAAACSGTLTIRLTPPAPPSDDAQIARCARGCRPLGRAHFRVSEGQTIAVLVDLSPYGRQLLAQRGTLPVTVTASVVSGSGTSTTVSTITLSARTGSGQSQSAGTALRPFVGLTIERSPRYALGG